VSCIAVQFETECLALFVGRQAGMQLPAGEDTLIGDADLLDLRAPGDYGITHLFFGLVPLFPTPASKTRCPWYVGFFRKN
jgi:hypothetical protein